MSPTLDKIKSYLKAATCPEDVFGTDKDGVNDRYRELAFQTHSDRHPSARTVAEEVFKDVGDWHLKALEKIKSGTYGDRLALDIKLKTKGAEYQIFRKMKSGDLCEVYNARNLATKDLVVIKVARSPRNNDLVLNEATQLKWLRGESLAKSMKVLVHVPQLLDTFELQQRKEKKRVNVFPYVEGAFTLEQIKACYPTGIDPRDAAWMFRRLIGALIACHQAELIHGAVLPSHVLVFPESHNAVLIDWSYSVKVGSVRNKISAISPRFRSFYPSELLSKKPATFKMDIYMAAKCLLYLLGDDVKKLPHQLSGLIKSWMLGEAHRTSKIWDVWEDFSAVTKELYGARKFRPFSMPTTKI